MISNELLNEIITKNESFGIKTEFYSGDSSVLGYAEGNTIYLNTNSDSILIANKHELLHFYEETETFKRSSNRFSRYR